MWLEVGCTEARQGDKGLTKERGEMLMQVKHFIVKNGCTNTVMKGMDQKINGRTDGWREQRLKMLEERITVRVCTLKFIVELWSDKYWDWQMSCQFRRGWKIPAVQALLIVCFLVCITTWWEGEILDGWQRVKGKASAKKYSSCVIPTSVFKCQCVRGQQCRVIFWANYPCPWATDVN